MFNYKQTTRDQALKKPVDNGVRTSSFGDFEGYKNKFVADLKDTNINPDVEPSDSFGNKKALEALKVKLPQITDGAPNFERDQDNLRAMNFLNKYRNSLFLAEEEKPSELTALSYIQGNPNNGLANRFPGSEGVSTT
jgi:hypothetical protein